MTVGTKTIIVLNRNENKILIRIQNDIKTSKLNLNLNKKNVTVIFFAAKHRLIDFYAKRQVHFFAVFRREIRNFAAEFRGAIPR